MKVGISNLAWLPESDAGVAATLVGHGVTSIDIAPGRYFGPGITFSTEKARALRAWWAGHGIAIDGMQGLFFGRPGLNLLGNAAMQVEALAHLERMCGLAAELGARELTLGSPKNRDRGDLPAHMATLRAVDVLGRAAEFALRHGVVICLEATPEEYGGTFGVSTGETAAVVAAVGAPALRLQLDTGTLFALSEPAGELVADVFPLVGHIHASEPQLGALGMSGAAHDEIAALCRTYLPGHRVTVEMLPPPGVDPAAAISAALAFAMARYGVARIGADHARA